MTTLLNHPNVTPPTKAPSAPLPAKALPNGSMNDATAPSAAVEGLGTTGGGIPGLFSSIGNTTILYALIGIGVVVIAGLLWYYRGHEEGYPSGGVPPRRF